MQSIAETEENMVKQLYPRVEINLKYLTENVATVVKKCSEKGIDISGKKTRPHSCKAEQKEFCLPFSHAQGGDQ